MFRNFDKIYLVLSLSMCHLSFKAKIFRFSVYLQQILYDFHKYPIILYSTPIPNSQGFNQPGRKRGVSKTPQQNESVAFKNNTTKEQVERGERFVSVAITKRLGNYSLTMFSPLHRLLQPFIYLRTAFGCSKVKLFNPKMRQQGFSP